MKEGHRYRSLHAAGPLSPRLEEPLCAAARAPRDFASETFRGFCGLTRGVGGGEEEPRGARGREKEREREKGRERQCEGEDEGKRSEWKRGLGGKTTVFPLIERLARGGGARRGEAEGRITCSNYLFLLRSASSCLAPASVRALAATC